MIYILLIIGFLFLIKGADFFVDGASNIAKKFNISQLIIGLTIVAMGTSLPEASVSISAGLQGSNELALSNVIGSNFFNTLVVVGICVLFKDMIVERSVIKKEFPFLILITVILYFMTTTIITKNEYATITRLDGTVLLILFIIFIVSSIVTALKENQKMSEKEKEENKKINFLKNLIILLIGGVAIAIGGDMVVDNATKIAQNFGVSETIIGLTIVAIGTSLPELVTSIVALIKDKSDMAIGNVVGSNLFNILFILGASSVLTPIKVNNNPSPSMAFDILFLIVITIMTYIFGITGKKINRIEGIIMLICYVGYLIFMFAREGIITF